MVTPEQKKRLLVSAANLRRARQMLPDAVAEGELARFNTHLQHDELDLAMDELVAVGESHGCRGGFWRNMERAAESMGLLGRANMYRVQFNLALPENTGDAG